MNKADKIIIFSFLLQGVCCRNFSISLPEKVEALSGSCVIIKCRFEIEDKYDTNFTKSAVTGLWLKDRTNIDKHQVFNSRDPKPNHFEGEITGKLHEKNCTTIFYNVSSNHNGKYYFRIESGDLKYTYKINTSTINATESPPKPTLKLYKVQDQEEVLEGSSVSLSCSAETLCCSHPPTLTWISTPRIPLSESSRQQELISDLNFTASHRHQRVTFTCTLIYQLQDKNKTAQDNITLYVQYAPKISSSSNSNSGKVSVYVCEVDGNPSPEVKWHLSECPVTNSSNTFISEERLGSTGLRSSITLHQSLTHTSTLECVGNNIHGTARKLFQPPPSVTCLTLSSVMTGVAVAALVFVMLCAIITCICVRKVNRKLLLTTQVTRSGQNIDEAAPDENQDDSIYVTMSPAEATTKNTGSLFSSSVDFKSSKSELQEFRGTSSSHSDYSTVQYCSAVLAEAESSMGDSSSIIESQVIVRADIIAKQTESKDSGEELFADCSQLYATVERRNP